MDKKENNHQRIFSDKSNLIKRDIMINQINIQERKNNSKLKNEKIIKRDFNNKIFNDNLESDYLQFEKIEKYNENNINTTREKNSIKYKDNIDEEKIKNNENNLNNDCVNTQVHITKSISISSIKKVKKKTSKNLLLKSNDNPFSSIRNSLLKEGNSKRVEKSKTKISNTKDNLTEDKNLIKSPQRKKGNQEIILSDRVNNMNIYNIKTNDNKNLNKIDIDIVNNINPHIFGNIISPKNSKSSKFNNNNSNIKVSQMKNNNSNRINITNYCNYSKNKNILKKQNYSNSNSIPINFNNKISINNQNITAFDRNRLYYDNTKIDFNKIENDLSKSKQSKPINVKLVFTGDNVTREKSKDIFENEHDLQTNNINCYQKNINLDLDNLIKNKNIHKSIDFANSKNMKNNFIFYPDHDNLTKNFENIKKVTDCNKEIEYFKKNSIQFENNIVNKFIQFKDINFKTNSEKTNNVSELKSKNQSLIESDLYRDLKIKQRLNKANNLTDLNINFDLKESSIKYNEPKNKIVIKINPTKYSRNENKDEIIENKSIYSKNDLNDVSQPKEKRDSKLTNYQINSYTNNYLAKRQNLIKNNKNLYQQNGNENICEVKNMIVQEKDDFLNSDNLTINKKNVENFNELNNLRTKNNENNNNMDFKTSESKNENFNVNRINSFPTHFFQMSELNETSEKKLDLLKNKKDVIKDKIEEIFEDKESIYIGLYPDYESTIKKEEDLINETQRFNFKNNHENFPDFLNLKNKSFSKYEFQNGFDGLNFLNEINLNENKIAFNKSNNNSLNDIDKINIFKINAETDNVGIIQTQNNDREKNHKEENHFFDTINSEYKTIEFYTDINSLKDAAKYNKIKEPNIFSRLQSYNINENPSEKLLIKKDNEYSLNKENKYQNSTKSNLLYFKDKENILGKEEDEIYKNPLMNSSYIDSNFYKKINLFESNNDKKYSFKKLSFDMNIIEKQNIEKKEIESKEFDNIQEKEYIKKNYNIKKNEKLKTNNNFKELNNYKSKHNSFSIIKDINVNKNLENNFLKNDNENIANLENSEKKIKIIINNNFSYFNQIKETNNCDRDNNDKFENQINNSFNILNQEKFEKKRNEKKDKILFNDVKDKVEKIFSDSQKELNTNKICNKIYSEKNIKKNENENIDNGNHKPYNYINYLEKENNLFEKRKENIDKNNILIKDFNDENIKRNLSIQERIKLEKISSINESNYEDIPKDIILYERSLECQEGKRLSLPNYKKDNIINRLNQKQETSKNNIDQNYEISNRENINILKEIMKNKSTEFKENTMNSSILNLNDKKRNINLIKDNIMEICFLKDIDMKNGNIKEISNSENEIFFSDEECTLSEDEKAIITNVPIFKLKRFTSFNIQTEIKFNQIENFTNFNNNIDNINNINNNFINSFEDEKNNNKLNKSTNERKIDIKTKNYSKYLNSGILKTLFVNSNKTKKSICKYLDLKDLVSISYVNKLFNNELKEYIDIIIKNMILRDNNIFIRYKIWKSIYSYSMLNKSENLKSIYIELINKESSYMLDILKDINRTFPEDITFRPGQINNNKLKNILSAYSNYNTKIGYAQGLNFIVAAAILIFPEEEQIFIFIDSLINKFKFNKIMGIDNSEVRSHLELIQYQLEKYTPKLCVFLSRNGLSHEFFSTSWIITIFANVVNHSTLFKIWDFFIIYGWKFFNSFLISIMLIFENKILNFDANYLSVLIKEFMKSKEFDKYFDKIVDKSFEIMRKESNLNSYTK
jgi:hypothetical protein